MESFGIIGIVFSAPGQYIVVCRVEDDGVEFDEDDIDIVVKQRK